MSNGIRKTHIAIGVAKTYKLCKLMMEACRSKVKEGREDHEKMERWDQESIEP